MTSDSCSLGLAPMIYIFATLPYDHTWASFKHYFEKEITLIRIYSIQPLIPDIEVCDGFDFFYLTSNVILVGSI